MPSSCGWNLNFCVGLENGQNAKNGLVSWEAMAEQTLQAVHINILPLTTKYRSLILASRIRL